jgi:hypothetical protein
MKNRNRTDTQASDQVVIDGIRKDLLGMPTLYLGGRVFTPQGLEDFFQGRIDAASVVVSAKSAWLDAGKAYDALDKNAQLVLRDLKRLVIGAFGDDSVKLADFGFPTPKKPVLTQEQIAAAVLKRAATRKARGTLGPKQRLAIKGVVPPTTTPAPTTTTTPSTALVVLPEPAPKPNP